MLKSLIAGVTMLAMLCLIALPVAAAPVTIAQASSPTEVSATDIERFANAYQSIRETQEEAEAQMIAAVEAEGLSLEEFNALVAAQDNPEESQPIPAETAAQFDSAIEQIVAIREDAQSEMEAEILAEGLEIAEFNAILEQAQEDEDLQQQIRSELESE